jgi:dTDP-4-dehydrorhamnose 3,5-epimerase
MRFERMSLPGAWTIELEPLEDERGWFARTFDAAELRARGMDPAVVQCSASFNVRRDTIRGLHYQAEPHRESKLVRCVRGAIFDVAVDLRPASPTYCRWYGVKLSAENRRAVHLPPGVAHGYQTLTEGCEVLYQMSTPHVPVAARGVRWDDPAFAIGWPPPAETLTISERDRSYPDFDPARP